METPPQPRHSQLVNLLVSGSKQPNLGTRCPARSPEARATQVPRSRQAPGSSLPHSSLTSFILSGPMSFVATPVCPALRANVPIMEGSTALRRCSPHTSSRPPGRWVKVVDDPHFTKEEPGGSVETQGSVRSRIIRC